MQTDAELDRIRQPQDDRILDRLWEREDEETRRAKRLDDAISEVSDLQLCLRKGNLDYMAASGVLTEYLPEILRGLLTLQSRNVKARI